MYFWRIIDKFFASLFVCFLFSPPLAHYQHWSLPFNTSSWPTTNPKPRRGDWIPKTAHCSALPHPLQVSIDVSTWPIWFLRYLSSHPSHWCGTSGHWRLEEKLTINWTSQFFTLEQRPQSSNCDLAIMTTSSGAKGASIIMSRIKAGLTWGWCRAWLQSWRPHTGTHPYCY